jgi:hypothetical protein
MAARRVRVHFLKMMERLGGLKEPEMAGFTVLAFGLCAALPQHAPFGDNVDDVVGIGQLKQNGTQCDMFFVGTSTGGDSIRV